MLSQSLPLKFQWKVHLWVISIKHLLLTGCQVEVSILPIDRSFSIWTEPCFSGQPASKEAGHNQPHVIRSLALFRNSQCAMLCFAFALSVSLFSLIWPTSFMVLQIQSGLNFVGKKVLLGGFICSSVQSVKGPLLTPADAGWDLERLLLHYLWRLLHRVHSLQAFQSFWIYPASAFQITKCVLLKKNKIKMVPINCPGSLHYIKVQTNA